MFSVPPLTPFVKKLIVTLFVAFVVELLLRNFVGIDAIPLLALDPSHLGPLTPIQMLTYVLVEDPRGVMSMLIGLFFMWVILSPFEATFGPRRVMELCVAGALGASLSALLVAQVLPTGQYLFLGSHPLAYAGMAAMARIMQRGRIMFFGVVPMTSKQLLLVLVGLCVLEFLSSKDHIMLAGSLGAIGAGIGYVRYMSRTPRPPSKKRPSGARFKVLRGGAGGQSSAPSSPGPDGTGDTSDGDGPKWLN